MFIACCIEGECVRTSTGAYLYPLRQNDCKRATLSPRITNIGGSFDGSGTISYSRAGGRLVASPDAPLANLSASPSFAMLAWTSV